MDRSLSRERVKGISGRDRYFDPVVERAGSFLGFSVERATRDGWMEGGCGGWLGSFGWDRSVTESAEREK
jgi:hypothetical protein